MTLKLLNPEGHTVTFWNLQFRIRRLEQERCADRIVRRENLACLRRMQLSRFDWLKDDDRPRSARWCKVCGKAFDSGMNTGRPRSYCDSCFKLHRRTYFQTRYLLKSKQNVSVKKGETS